MSTEQPNAFISYSHGDRRYAEQLTSALSERGIRVWIDTLEIRPGDSLVTKIFEEGLRDCQLFLVLLSKSSVRSEWVRHELDIALINRLKHVTRVIPLLVEQCDIPVALRSLRWLDLSDGMDRVADLIAATAFDRSESPPIGSVPRFVQQGVRPRAGLSQEACTVAGFLARNITTSQFPNQLLDGGQIHDDTGLPAELINDAVDELSANGLVKILKVLGTAPFTFGWVEPTYALAYTFPELVRGKVDPENDPHQVAAAVASLGHADGAALTAALNFEPNRLNFAIEYLRDYGLIETRNFIGTAPYSFGRAVATRVTRQAVR